MWGFLDHLDVVFTYIGVAYILLMITMYASLHGKGLSSRMWQTKEIPTKAKDNRSLIVIAHPDDEVMFFGPTILGLLKKGSVYILCLSMGDFNKKGHRRKYELYDSCRTLGIKSENVTVLSHQLMPDGPEEDWPVNHLAPIIKIHALSLGINTLVTFDPYGVSGHLNHISIYNAVVDLMDRDLLKGCRVFVLESVNIFRKYFFIDLPICYLTQQYLYVNTGRGRSIITEAMQCHQSQRVWFRKLYMIFSRYVTINSLHEIYTI